MQFLPADRQTPCRIAIELVFPIKFGGNREKCLTLTFSGLKLLGFQASRALIAS